MKITVKKEYDTAEVVEKLEKVLRKMEDRTYVMVDKNDIKAIIDIIKYFESDYQKYKSETLKIKEKCEDDYIVGKMKVADIKAIFSCFGGYDKSLICCCTFCGVRESCKEYTQKV